MAEYIWNGVGLTASDGWEPSALERDGLLLEHDGQPACEVKWRTVEGSFSFEKHLKRLAKQHKGVEMQGVAAQETPLAWQEAVATLERTGLRTHSFIWRTPFHKGIGAALHHPGTGLAGLIQFFIGKEEDEAVAAEVLATFRDYGGGKTIPWAMFGLSARLPRDYVLDTFSFKPGHYLVKFWRPKSGKQAGKLPAGKGPGTALVFERFAPASVLLKDRSLVDWMQGGMENSPSGSIAVNEMEGGVAWSGIAKSSMLRKALRREHYSAGRVWTSGAGNAILCVTANGVVPVADDTFKTICDSYALV